MRERRVEPEILDTLPVEDFAGQRSRRDLRRVNALMGNFRWIERCLAEWKAGGTVTELGAGDGLLAARLARRGHAVRAMDRAPRPGGLPAEVAWTEGDVLETLNEVQGAVVASLFLHHFEDKALGRLGKLIRQGEFLCFAEPLRSPFALAEGYALFPLVNSVTRHDMIISIRAGFRKGELPRLLGLDGSWQIVEETTMLGGYRLRAQRR